MKKYAKFLIALGGAAIVVGKALADGQLDQTEAAAIVVALATAAGVYRVPNAEA